MKSSPRLRGWALLACGLLPLALWHGGMAWMTDRGVRRVEASMAADPAAREAGEGWRARRFFIDPDSYGWLTHARELRASGGWRVRWTMADNAPWGREVRWAQLPIWLLAGMSRALEGAGLPPPLALELAGRILMPAVGLLFTAMVFLFLERRGGGFLAFLGSASMAVCAQYHFHTMRPDHHGFQIALFTGVLLCLLGGGAGGCRTAVGAEGGEGALGLPTRGVARRHFIWAGIWSGMALWLGATVFVFGLGAMGAALALRILWWDRKEPGVELCPEVFRWWGGVGAGVALLLHGVEQAPGIFEMRLEANHPLHALCLLGVAEGLRALALWRGDRAAFGGRDGWLAAGGVLGAVASPALMVAGPVAWFWPRSVVMLRLHERFIIEFRSLWGSGSWGGHFENLPLMAAGAVAGAAGLAWAWRRGVPRSRRGSLGVLGVVAAVFFGLSCWQVRWVQFLHPCLVLLIAFGWAAACGAGGGGGGRTRAARWGCVVAGLLALAPGAATAAGLVKDVARLNRVAGMSDFWLRMLLQRNALLELKAARAGEGPARLMMPVEMAPAAHYFGAGTGVGSLYWENLAGVAAEAEFFADPLPGARTFALAGERGITHVVVDEERGEGDAYTFYHLWTGRSDYEGVAATVGHALAGAEGVESDWLRLDGRLTEAVARPWHVYLPEAGRWAAFRLPLRVYRVGAGAGEKGSE